MKKVNEFFQSEKERLEAEQQANIKGRRKFFVAPVGETRMTIIHKIPRTVETQYGSRKIFSIIVDNEEHDFTVNQKSPLYRYLVRSLAKAKSNVDIVLVRTGSGKATKYDVKEA